MDLQALWRSYKDRLCSRDELGLRLDLSRMGLEDGFLTAREPDVSAALQAMEALEEGALANVDEGRQVGHYWLRSPARAPQEDLRAAILQMQTEVAAFAEAVHSGHVGPRRGGRFSDVLLIGIGGSALGPQLLADALGDPRTDRLRLHFFDNTDPDGMDRVLTQIGDRLPHTLVLVVSKSGGTAETRNGMLVAQAALEALGLDLPSQAAAITGAGSRLDQMARQEGWLARFPMWSWVGGRTSITSAVGLLPAALLGLDTDALLAGAAACDEATRDKELRRNPAALLALAWYHATGGQGRRDMVILPYRDRLMLMSRYLQQLVMESLGKGTDLDGRPVAQGIAVYGNKGSTDQHAYVQQLREGVDNFFVTFIEVLADGGRFLEVEPGITSGDYLRGFYLGTRQALAERGRPSLTVTLDRLDGRSLGVLIALYERAVGLYASLVHVNAYHQPGVEAGKKAAADVLEVQRRAVAFLAQADEPLTADAIAVRLGAPGDAETIFHVLEGLAANRRGVRKIPTQDPTQARFEAGPTTPNPRS
ncbi:MAG: glucose-6-phosphate isomerase [Acidobacteria bacterium]|nr:glucose-6-phosphate isomerase [Acidobacteriota bacterium]